MATYLSLPGRPQNPLSYLGILGFICFILLGVTGMLLQVYYVPTPAGSFASVVRISNDIPYGFELRNLHYWLSNVMMVLALAHFFYLYFTRKYLPNNEILWISGIFAGVLTLAETFTGYSLVMNARSVFATEIGIGILRNAQPSLAGLLQGVSTADTILRMYVLHILMVPAVLGVLFFAHFPRRLTVDIPVALTMIGLVIVIGGLLPVELGSSVSLGSGIMIPEWYLTGVYALLRTGLDVLLAAVILPLTFVLAFVLVPFVDKKRYVGGKQRALQAATGITALTHTVLITFWGFRAANPLQPIESAMDLPINPNVFYGILGLMAAMIFCAALLLSRKMRPKIAWTAIPQKNVRVLSGRVAALIVSVILLFQIALLMQVLYVQPSAPKEIPMIEGGLSVLGFAAVSFVYGKSSDKIASRTL
jgi:ubiquinol-cytochrome c reductase cytochrome b subunit